MTAMLEPVRQDAIRSSATTLARWATYVLPAELDRRILDLSERKESLSATEHAELLAWVQFTQQRSLDQLKAESALQRLQQAFPDMVDGL